MDLLYNTIPYILDSLYLYFSSLSLYRKHNLLFFGNVAMPLYSVSHSLPSWLADRCTVPEELSALQTFHFPHNERTPIQISLQYLHWCWNYYRNAGFGSEWDTLYQHNIFIRTVATNNAFYLEQFALVSLPTRWPASVYWR